jgi:hypothetical protein
MVCRVGMGIGEFPSTLLPMTILLTIWFSPQVPVKEPVGRQRRHKVRLSPQPEIILRVEEPQLYPDVVMRVEEPPLPLMSMVTRTEIPNRYVDEYERSRVETQGATGEVFLGEDDPEYTRPSLLWS